MPWEMTEVGMVTLKGILNTDLQYKMKHMYMAGMYKVEATSDTGEATDIRNRNNVRYTVQTAENKIISALSVSI